MHKLFFLLLLPLLLLTAPVRAQDLPAASPPGERAGRLGDPAQREVFSGRIQAAREVYLTEQLALTAKEAAAFFPVYWAYDEQMREAKRATQETYRSRATSGALRETEAQELLLRDRTFRQEMLTLRNQTEDKLLKILPAAKVIRIPEIEKEFRRKLWDRARGRRGRN